jgi:hypothetical protein
MRVERSDIEIMAPFWRRSFPMASAIPGLPLVQYPFAVTLSFIDAPRNAEAKVRAKAVLIVRQAAWDALDERLGYSRARQAEEEAFELQRERLNDVFANPARSISGVAAKLHAVLAMGGGGPGDEFPWPQIRAAMTDLLSLGSGASTI